MPEPHSSAASGVLLGIKHGIFAAVFVTAVSLLSVVVGFAVVPLTPGKETLDAARRLAAGLLCSLFIGPFVGLWAINTFPWMLTPLQAIFSDFHPLIPTVIALTPFIAVSGVVGFWAVAALMLFFTKREGKDIKELIKDAKE